jgi:hydrogenase-4 membrane subunit HyfE
VGDILIRFLIGGLVVSFFSILADVLRPKSFAGLLGAAPSIALATLGLTIRHNGIMFAATEARSMILGAGAFLAYALVVSWLLRRYQPAALTAALLAMPVWFLIALGLWHWIGRAT